MFKLTSGVVLLLCCSVQAAPVADDVANERPPVSARDLEQHWGLDCQATALAVRQWLASEGKQAATPQRWQQDLQKCGFIQQRDGRPNPCPDYAAAAAALGKITGADGLNAQVSEQAQGLQRQLQECGEK